MEQKVEFFKKKSLSSNSGDLLDEMHSREMLLRTTHQEKINQLHQKVEKLQMMMNYYKEMRDSEKCKINDDIMHMKSHLLKSLKDLQIQITRKGNNNQFPGGQANFRKQNAHQFAKNRNHYSLNVQERDSSRAGGNSILTYPTAIETLPVDHPHFSTQQIKSQLTAQKKSYQNQKNRLQQVTESKKKPEQNYHQSKAILKENLRMGNQQQYGQSSNEMFLSPIKPILNHNLENINPMDLTEIEKESMEIENRINRLKKKSEMDMIKRSSTKSRGGSRMAENDRERLQDYEMMKQKYGARLYNRGGGNGQEAGYSDHGQDQYRR